MAPTKTWLGAVGLCLISSAAAARLGAKVFIEPQSHSEADLVKYTKPSPRVHVGKVDGVSRRQDEGCYGTCASCFGDDYRECPNNESLCYSPNDPTSGCDSVIPDFDFDFPDFDDLPGTEYCTSGESCEECFGDGYELCPGSSSVCWNPDDPEIGCEGSISDDPLPDDSDDIDMPGETEWCTGNSCAECFGSGWELCPGSTMMCWNPDIPSSSVVCDEADDGLDDDDNTNDDDDDDDDDAVTDEDPVPTESDDAVPTLGPFTPSPSPTSGSNDDGNDGPRSGGDLDDGSAGDSSDDDDNAAGRIGMSLLPVIAGAVGVAALL